MKLSIIIAAYNVEKFIEKCIYSCVHQNFDKTLYEIVVVNDGSTDKTPIILNRLKKEINNLKVIHQENSGLGASRNRGLKESKGKFVWFIDGDDYLEENVLQSIVSEIKKNKLDVLVLDYAVVNANYQILSTKANELVAVNGVITGSEFYENNYEKSYSWLFVFKQELFLKHEIKFKERINMQDSEILPKLLINTQRISAIKEVCYNYMQQAKSYTNSNNGNKRFKYFESIVEVYNSLQYFLINNVADDKSMENGIKMKLQSFHTIIFNHLIFFQYEKERFLKIIKLLKATGFYPLKAKALSKMWFIKLGMNTNPFITKRLFDFIRSVK